MFSGVDTTTPALAHRERRLRLARVTVLVAVAGGITTLVAGSYLFDEFAAVPLLISLGGLAVLAGGVLATRRVLNTVRYRIDRPYSGAWLAGKIVTLLAAFAGAAALAAAVDAPSLPRRVLALLLVGALAWVITTHGTRWTLFQVDATGLKLGRAAVPWPAVAQLDLALAARGTAEIGVQLVAGQVVTGTPAQGTVLADLPVCTIVPAAAVHVDRIGWAVREFGNPAIPVVVRGQAADPTPTPPEATPQAPPLLAAPAPPPPSVELAFAPAPAPRRRGWVIGGAVGLAAVLVAGVVTAVVLLDDKDAGQTGTAAEPEQPNTYSAAGVEDPCDLIDVYVLKRWSTVPEIITEPSQDTSPDYDWLHCGAHSDSQYLVGRVTHLEMVAAVAESDAAARDFFAEQKSKGLWIATGDVKEDGEVEDLGETAEFEQAIATYGDHTRSDYVLRVLDGNLAFFLKFGSDADQSDGAGVGVQTLADAAITQARGAMEKLRARPVKKAPRSGKDREPAEVPKTVNEAATAPSTEDLMARIRAADPCELHDREFVAGLGRVETEPHQSLGLAECRLMATSPAPGSSRLTFGIQLNGYLSEEERADLVREELDDRELFHSKPDPSGNSCVYHVPYGRTGFGAEVSVSRYVPGVENQAPWPDACEMAAEYTTRVAEDVEELTARSAPAPEPTLVGKDACAVDEVAALLPDWKPGPVTRFHSASCTFTMTQGDESYEFDLDFDRDAEQLGDEPATVGGLTGVWIRYEGLCSLSLVYVPESAPDAWDAHNISASVQWKGHYGSTGTQDVCALAEESAQKLIERVS